MTNDDHLYRRSVGVMLLNREGKVFVGARIDNTDEAWQMPQGGIDKGEDPWDTALRELEEETGIEPRLVEQLTKCPERLRYDLPEAARHRLWGGKWKGQLQDWYLARFLGDDSDVNIATKHPEFRDWKWIEPAQVLNVDSRCGGSRCSFHAIQDDIGSRGVTVAVGCHIRGRGVVL